MRSHASMKLGKAPARHDPRTLQFANYVKTSLLPTPPDQVDYSTKVGQWGMMENDKIGDCTCAAAGHLIMEWTANAAGEIAPTDDQIVAAYSAITGYDPQTGQNDKGAIEIDVLNYWRQTGIAGRQILAYVALEPKNHDHIRDAVYLFEGCYIGLALPVSAQTQTVWSVPPGGAQGSGAPGSWGGHAVPVVAYDAQSITVITWGAPKQMTWAFWDAYCDESYAVLSNDILKDGKAPTGFDLAALQQDLQEITNPASPNAASK